MGNCASPNPKQKKVEIPTKELESLSFPFRIVSVSAEISYKSRSHTKTYINHRLKISLVPDVCVAEE